MARDLRYVCYLHAKLAFGGPNRKGSEISTIFKDAKTGMNRLPKSESASSFEGLLLVAAPRNSDPFFARSVCLIVEQSESGIAGVVLNRPVISDVEPLWKQLTEGSSKTAEPPAHLHFGGPVAGPVVAIHDQELLADAGNGKGIYLAAQVETLRKLTFVSPDHYRMVVGHTAWKKDELEKEIREGLWYLLPASPELVFCHDEEIWVRSMRMAGNRVLQKVTGIKGIPQSPALN